MLPWLRVSREVAVKLLVCGLGFCCLKGLENLLPSRGGWEEVSIPDHTDLYIRTLKASLPP